MAASDRQVTIHFDGKDHTFELTLGEIEELEDAYDKPIEEISFNRTKTVLMLVKFAKLRENPRANPERVMDELRGMTLEVLEPPVEEERPTKPAKRVPARDA